MSKEISNKDLMNALGYTVKDDVAVILNDMWHLRSDDPRLTAFPVDQRVVIALCANAQAMHFLQGRGIKKVA